MSEVFYCEKCNAMYYVINKEKVCERCGLVFEVEVDGK